MSFKMNAIISFFPRKKICVPNYLKISDLEPEPHVVLFDLRECLNQMMPLFLGTKMKQVNLLYKQPNKNI